MNELFHLADRSEWEADADDLVLLVIDADRVEAPVAYEPPEAGVEDFPHVYGPIPVTAVVDVRPVTRDATGRFVLPV